MRRLVLFVAICGLPLSVAAQTPPVPPTPPSPVPVPAPPVPTPMAVPVPPVPPRPMIAPVYVDEYAMQEAVRAAREASRIDAEAARHMAEEARQAAKAVTHEMADFKFHLEDWHLQDRAFSFSFSQEGDSNYSSGLNHLNQRQYDQAIARFDRAIAQKSPRSDAAMYHKAYAQFRLGQTTDAVATIAQLRRDYPQSRYLNDAKVLEADARRLKPEQIAANDDEIKLLAINAMQHSDPERAIPLLEEQLSKNNSLSVKKRAIFVLAQISNPKARAILLNYAKGAGNPDLQLEAIRYLVVNRDKQTASATSAELQQIYSTTQDTAVKLAIIGAFRNSNNTPALVSIAGQAGTPVAIRQSAVSGIASIGTPQDLWALYQKEENRDLRLQMVSAFGSMQALEQLNQILKTEKDPEVRRRAVRSLGGLRTEQTGKMLVDMYGTETDVDTRKAVISALASQNNAEALVAIAKKETNPPLKTDIVRRLTELASRSKVAQDYLMELIKGGD